MSIAIIGAGLSGLYLGYRLRQQGFSVKLFDVADRVGGRIRTLNPMPGLCYEAGAEFVDGHHQRMQHLASELSVSLRSVTQNDEWMIFKNRLFFSKQARESIERIRQSLDGKVLELIEELREPPWEGKRAELLDGLPVSDFLDRCVKSSMEQFILSAYCRGDEGEDTDKVSTLGWLYGYSLYLTQKKEMERVSFFSEGASTICERLSEKLGSSIALRHGLMAVEQNADGVTLHFQDHAERFDQTVLTLPITALRNIAFQPGMEESQQTALFHAGCNRVVKIALCFRKAWWYQRHWNGWLFSDGWLQEVWPSGLDNKYPVLMVYVSGEKAALLAAMKNPTASVLAELYYYFPEAKKHFLQGYFHSWLSEPGLRCAHSFFPLHFLTRYRDALIKPHGRIHFAGEHTARWQGFMEGALESAERVVQEIMDVA